MEEFTMLQSMLNILNSHNPKKKAVIEVLPILLDAYDIHGEFDIYHLIVANLQKLCFQVFDPQFENSAWKDSDVSLDNLKSLLVYFIDIIKKHSSLDIIQLFQGCVEFSNKIDFKNCSNERIKNIEFCMQKLYISCKDKIDDYTHLNQLRSTLINVLNEPYLSNNKLNVILTFLNNIMSVHYIPNLWQNIKPMIKPHPDRVINVIFNMQCLFFDSLCVDAILNDSDFWNLICNSLTSENNVARTYTNVLLKLSKENDNYYPNKSKVKVWNDYVIVMETLENTQQHLTLPILSTTKNLAINKTYNGSDDYQLPLRWITAMYCKMSKHRSKYVVSASIDIITNMPTVSLKMDEKLLQLFVNSLNNVFLYKMSSELYVNQPKLEITLSLWFNKLMMSSDGHNVFNMFLSYIPTIKWSIVPLIFLTKSLANISLDSSLGFNVIDHVLKIKSAIEKIPNSYLKNVVLSFLFIFTSKFITDVNTVFCCDLFDCITVYHNETKSWEYMINSMRKVNNLDHVDKQLLQRLNENQNIYSTSIGLLILSNISISHSVCMTKLDEICSNTVDVSNLLDFLEHLLEVESQFGRYDTCISQILDKHIWPLTKLLVDTCLQILGGSCDDPVISSFLDKVLSSNRIVNTTQIMNTWLIKCNLILTECSGNYSILAIYSWIGKYTAKYSTENTLKNDWLSYTKYFIESGYFSLKNKDFYQSKKPGIHKIPQLDIINTFFQYSTVSEEKMLDIFDWFAEKTVERHDNYWSIYFLTAKTFFCKFPIQVYSKKIIEFIKNCWEFLVSCRVSCFPNTTKSFIEMTFHYNLLSDEKYMYFVKNQVNIFSRILTVKVLMIFKDISIYRSSKIF